MIIPIVLFVLALVAAGWLYFRAQRQHTSILTVLHAETSALETRVEKLESHFDGGTIPQ